MADEILSGLKGIKAEIKAVQDQMVGLDAGSQEFVKLAQRAGELRDQMKDVAEAVNANAGPAIGNFGNNLSIARGQLGELDITGFGESMKRMGANVKSVSFKDMTEGVKSVGGGFASLGKALLVNPIFLIATAILGIVANFEKLTQAGGLVGKIFGTIGDFVNIAKDAFFAFTDAIGLTDTKAAELAEAQKKRNEEMLADLQKANDAVDKMREGMARGRMTERAKELADIQKWFDEQLYAARGNEELRNEIIAVAREKRDEINAKYDKQDADKAQAEAEKKKALDEKALAEAIRLRELDQKNFEDTIQSKDATLVNGVNKQIELQTTLTAVTISEEEKRTAAEKKSEEDKKQIMQAAWDSKYELALAATRSMMALNDALTQSGIISAEKGFKIGKALSIAQTTISTIEGVQNALNAASTLPEPFGMALKVANAVTIGAAGAASIAKIAATQFEGGTTPPGTINMPSPSGGAMGGGGGQAPAALNLSGLQGNISNAPLQTYVLAGQVSNAQQAEFKIKNTASILGGG
jgi:hypothetical protein